MRKIYYQVRYWIEFLFNIRDLFISVGIGISIKSEEQSSTNYAREYLQSYRQIFSHLKWLRT